MLSFTRWLPRLACATVLLACADRTDPAAPSTDLSLDEAPQPILESGGPEPTPAELAAMPAEFRTNPTLLDYSTDVAFAPAENRVRSRGYMEYFATNAKQEVRLTLRYENREVATGHAYGEDSHFFPGVRTLLTTAALGVGGPCGHLADGASVHSAWHQFIAGGWKFFSWGTTTRSSQDDDRQSPCAPPPPTPVAPPAGPDDPGVYEPVCEFCQQWLEFTYRGDLLAIWWECEPVDLSYCETYLT
jgi:hypothetical protein